MTIEVVLPQFHLYSKATTMLLELATGTLLQLTISRSVGVVGSDVHGLT